MAFDIFHYKFQQYIKKVGVDKAIAYSSGASVLSALASFVTLYFIGLCLTEEVQGYYYTFGSLLALQTFFDLGFTGIMTQYVAHERAHLEWDDSKLWLNGDDFYKSRLSSLLHFCVKWYTVISGVMLVVLIIVGFVFFSRFQQGADVEWGGPWIAVCIGTSLNLFLAPILAYLRGLDKVKEVSKIFFYRQMIIPVITWVGLLVGMNLYVLGIASICSALYVFACILNSNFRSILSDIWKNNITSRVDYMKEIFPYQWKISLSWVSGYFLFQLFNPVLFATEGAVVAGQMGMTLQVLNGISGLTMNWINTKIPQFSFHIERKEYADLDKLFFKTLKQESSVCLFLIIFFIFLIYIISQLGICVGGTLLSERFLPIIPLILMSIPIYCNQFSFSFATYLRCHKKEPFLVNSIVMGLLSSILTITLGNIFGLYGITVGYCILTAIIGLPWATYIFYIKRKQWHIKYE